MQNLIIVRTLSDVEGLKTYLIENDFISFDTETTGVEKSSQIIGMSFSADPETGYYVILQYWDNAKGVLIEMETNKAAKELVTILKDKNIIMHNAVFDCDMVNNNYAVDLMPAVHTDTMILSHLLDENRRHGLKELGATIFGEDAKDEYKAVKESVLKNGGVLTRDLYELYKADPEVMAQYGAKDAILTIKLFYHFVPQLIEQGLDKFFYEDESMPQLRGPTYHLNTTGLKVDQDRLQKLRGELEADCMEARAFVYKEIVPIVADKYPGTTKAKTFNIDAPKQLAWLLFEVLGNDFGTLTKGGKDATKALELKVPYLPSDKRAWIRAVKDSLGQIYADAAYNPKTEKLGRPKKVAEWWHYTQCGRETLGRLSTKYKWVEVFLKYKQDSKLLGTYVLGIQSRVRYGIIRPSFLQHGTTSGRYSSRNPNFQNLPRDDKRVKACIVARPGNVLIGADFSQLEPRVFASVSQDPTLMNCFSSGDDFYSVVGASVFSKTGYSLNKDEPGSFAKTFPQLRDRAKVFALATPYGRTAAQQAMTMGIAREESQSLIDNYFYRYPSVLVMMLKQHEEAKSTGLVYSIYGRPRRIPAAVDIPKIYGKNTEHSELPYEARTLLNLAMNHAVQGTAANIMNRAAIAICQEIAHNAQNDPRWANVRMVMQVHDEIILEGPEALQYVMADMLRDRMENTVSLPGVDLVAKPIIGKDLASLK